MRGELVRDAFAFQAKACAKLGSPFTARLCRVIGNRISPENEVGRTVLSWKGDPSPYGDSVPLRLAGALRGVTMAYPAGSLASVYPPNGVDGDQEVWRAVRQAFGEHEDFILERLKYAPQTNEIGRSSVLYCGLSLLSDHFGTPLVLSELGASAGLNLLVDQYRYQFGSSTVGNPKSGIELTPKWNGAAPPTVLPDIALRRGCDLNPLDVHSRSQMDRMLSFIWADQTERIERTQKAIEVAKSALPPGAVEKCDAAKWLERILEQEIPGRIHTVMHTIAWQYFPKPVQRDCEMIIIEAGKRATKEAPVAWLSLEGDGRQPGAAIRLQTWPGGEVADLGRADYHGRWIDWKL